MAKKKRSEWEVRTYGEQRSELDVDLMTQIVMMLGRQLANETLAEGDEPPTDADEQGSTS
jgi:hypothetical protein